MIDDLCSNIRGSHYKGFALSSSYQPSACLSAQQIKAWPAVLLLCSSRSSCLKPGTKLERGPQKGHKLIHVQPGPPLSFQMSERFWEALSLNQPPQECMGSVTPPGDATGHLHSLRPTQQKEGVREGSEGTVESCLQELGSLSH